MSRILNHPDYLTTVKWIKIMVRRGVFTPDPKITPSTSLLLEYLDTIDLKGKSVLDIGSGSGIIAIYCALQGAKHVVAADIDDKAIANTKENIKLNKVTDVVIVIKSNLFEKITEKFDVVIGNLPIFERTWRLKVQPVDLLEEFLSKLKNHIYQQSIAVFTWITRPSLTQVKTALKEHAYTEVIKQVRGKEWPLFILKY